MKTLFLFLCLALCFTGCKKPNEAPPHQSTGVLAGIDNEYCPSLACNVIKITISNDTAKNPPPFYLTNSTLPQMGIDSNTKFPIKVSLDYKPDTGYLATGLYVPLHFIIVSQVKVINYFFVVNS
jgi:hypothetical protein